MGTDEIVKLFLALVSIAMSVAAMLMARRAAGYARRAEKARARAEAAYAQIRTKAAHRECSPGRGGPTAQPTDHHHGSVT